MMRPFTWNNAFALWASQSVSNGQEKIVMIYSRRHDDVLEIVIDNPPVNALGFEVRRSLIDLIEQAQADDSVKSIIVRGAGKMFSAGADISEFGDDPIDPPLSRVVDIIESSGKPTIAAIHGMALGGGLEIALGCHYRLAAHTARLGLPEVTLGLLPGAGGTQRLPRLIAVAAALDMIALGRQITANAALDLGLLDRLAAPDTLPQEAIAFARTLSAPRRSCDRSPSADADAFMRFATDNARKLKGLDAPVACIEAIRAATELPLVQGLAKERALFQKLVAGDQSKALRHVFFAHRAARKIKGLTERNMPRKIERIGIIGAGTMGVGIAMNFLSSAMSVTILEMTQEALDRGVSLILGHYDASVVRGRVTREQAECAIAFLTPSLDFEALADCDLIIEAAYEDMAVKTAIFARLDGIARSGAVLASNTSYLSIDDIAAVTNRPADVIGMHFFSPAHVMKLLEVVRGRHTAPDVLETALCLARRIGKVPVVAGVCYGFIGNRMLIPQRANADALLLEGASPEQIDRVHTDFGMPMGPFAMTDLAGLDIGWHRDPTRIENIRDALCAERRWGQKTGAGFYDYDAQRKPSHSGRVAEIVDSVRALAGIKPRKIGDDEIVVRTFYTMVNEGAKVLEDRIAERASDIDVVWINGYGWPRHTGGPMFWANHIGLPTIVRALERYADRLGSDFQISPMLRQERLM